MSDQETLSADALQGASGSAASDAPEEDQSTGEQVSEDQPEPVTKKDLANFKQDVQSLLEDGLQRNRQSQKDTIEDRVAKSVDSAYTQMLESIAPEGTDLKDLRRKAWIDSQLENGDLPDENDVPDGSPQAPSGEGGTSKSLVQREIEAILQEHGLSGDEPELQEYVQQNQGTPWYQAGPGFAELAESIASRDSSPANIMGTGSGQSPPSPDLEQAYIKEVAALRGEGRGFQDRMQKLRQVKEKYRKQNLDVDQIDVASVL